MASNKPLKIVGIVLGLFVLLIIVAVVVLNIMFPPEKIKTMVLLKVEEAVGRSIDVEGAGISIYPIFGVKIKGLKIANTERKGYSSDPFVTLDEFLVSVKVLPLLQKKLAVKAVIFRKPTILVEVNRMGSFNYEDLAFMAPKEGTEKVKAEKPEKKEKKPGGPPALPIPMTMEKFAIEDGKVIYNDYREGRYITIGNLNHRIDFSIDKELKGVTSTGELVLADIAVRTGEIPKPLTGVTFSFSHDVGVNVVDGDAVLKDVRISLQKIYIACSGTVKNFNTEPVLDLKIKTEKISIEDLLAEVPVELFPDIARLKAKGFIQLAMILGGTIDASGVPRLKGKFTLGDGHIQYADLPEPISDIRANIAFTKNSVVISDLGFNLGKNPVALKARIENFAMPNVDAVLRATVNLDDLKNVVALPEGVALSGTIKSNITARGIVDPSDPMKVNIDGSIAVTNLRAKTPGLPKPVVVNGTMNFSPKQIANNMSIGVGSSNVKIDAKIADYLALVVKDSTKKSPRPKLNFNVVSTMLNTDDLMAPQKKTASQPAETGAPAKPAPAATGPAPILAAPLPGIDMNGTINCKRILYQGVEMSNFVTRISSVNDIMKVNTRANMFSGALSNDVNMDARNLDNVRIANTFSISKIQVNDFISNLNIWMGDNQPLLKDLDQNLFGTLTLHTNFKTNGATTEDATRNLDGTINAKVANGKIKSNVFTDGINGKVAGFAKKVRLPIDNLINIGDITFSSLKFLAQIKDERVFFNDFSLDSRATGNWNVAGNVGFDGGLDVVLTDRLPKNVSKRVLAVQDKVKGGASKLIKQGEGALSKKLGSEVSRVLGNAAAKKLDETFITPDREGRVTMFINYGGNVAAPKPEKFGFRRHEGTCTEQKTTAKQVLKKELKKKVETVKKETVQKVKKEVEKQVKKVTQEVKKEAVKAVEKQVPTEVKEETKKATKDVKKKAKKKLKKLFQ